MTSLRSSLLGAVLLVGATAGCGAEVVGAAQIGPAAPMAEAPATPGAVPPAEVSTGPGTPTLPTPATSPTPPTSTAPGTASSAGPSPSAGADPSAPGAESAEADREALVAAMVAGYADVTSMSTTIQTSGAGLEMTLTIAQEMADGTPTAMDMAMEMSVAATSIDMHLVMVDGRFYMSGPLAEQYAGGKKYLEVTDDSGSAEIQELYDLFQESKDQASATAHRNMLGAMNELVDAGDDVVGGVPARRYDAVVDVEKLLALTATTEGGAAQMEAMTSMGISEFPMTFWFDEQGRVLRVKQELVLLGQTVTTTSENAAFNEPVEIVAPDPDDVGQG